MEKSPKKQQNSLFLKNRQLTKLIVYCNLASKLTKKDLKAGTVGLRDYY